MSPQQILPLISITYQKPFLYYDLLLKLERYDTLLSFDQTKIL